MSPGEPTDLAPSSGGAIPEPFAKLYRFEHDSLVLRDPAPKGAGWLAGGGATAVALAVLLAWSAPQLLTLALGLGLVGAGGVLVALARAGGDALPGRIGPDGIERNGRRLAESGVVLAGQPGGGLTIGARTLEGVVPLLTAGGQSRAAYEGAVAMARLIARVRGVDLVEDLDHDAWVRFFDDPDEPRRVQLRQWVERSRLAVPAAYRVQPEQPPDVLADVDKLRWRGLLLHPHGLQTSTDSRTMEEVLAIDLVYTGYEGVVAATRDGVVTLIPLTVAEAGYGRWFVEQVRQAKAGAGDRGSHQDVPDALHRVSARSTELSGRSE